MGQQQSSSSTQLRAKLINYDLQRAVLLPHALRKGTAVIDCRSLRSLQLQAPSLVARLTHRKTASAIAEEVALMLVRE